MAERYLSFADYIREYGLERGEGLLLRHLMQAYKVLAQTVPADFKTEPVVELEDYFRELIRGIDSSLLEEWERLRNPAFVAAEAADKPARPSTYDVTRDAAAFRRLVRTAVLGVLQDAASRDWEAAAARLRGEADEATEARRIERLFTAYADARGRFRLDPEGRAAKHTHVEEVDGGLQVSQVLIDVDEANDWEAVFHVDLPATRAAQSVVLRLLAVRPIGA